MDMGMDMTRSPDMSAQGITWTTTVIDISTMRGLQGVNVCIYPGNQTCAMTNSAGTESLPVPENSQFMLSYTLSGYVPAYTESTSTTVSDTNNFLLVSTSNEGLLAGAVGKSLDTSKASMVYLALDTNRQPIAGVSFTMTTPAGDGIYYFGSSGYPSTSATQTSTNGIGFVINAPAADYDVTATATGKSCAGTPTKSWPGMTASSVKARAIAGAVTTVAFTCQ